MSKILLREAKLRLFQQLHQNDEPDTYRASGAMRCNMCNLTYREHLMDIEHPGWNGEPMDNRLCDGRVVHL